MKKRRFGDGGSTEPMDLEMEIPESSEVKNTRGMSVEDETGAVNSRLKRNPETGELYDTQKDKPKPKAKKKPTFAEKAKKANFTSAETGGGAALMYRKPMAKGGSASSRADGIASKGKTRGRMC